MITPANAISFGHTDSIRAIDIFCISMFLLDVFAQMLCEPSNDYKYGASDSIYRFIVGFAIKVAQQPLNVVHEQRQ